MRCLITRREGWGMQVIARMCEKFSLKACSKELRKKQRILNKLRLLWHYQESPKIHR